MRHFHKLSTSSIHWCPLHCLVGLPYLAFVYRNTDSSAAWMHVLPQHVFNFLSTPETPQFAMRFAGRYVLHHFSSRDIHRCKDYQKGNASSRPNCWVASLRTTYCHSSECREVGHLPSRHGRPRMAQVRMILPQVHLRKPCYDFSFL